jgi:hypothetical protein
MAISFVEATRMLLSGAPLSWDKFGDHKGGSILLGEPAQRRLLAFLLAQDAPKVAQGTTGRANRITSRVEGLWNGNSSRPLLGQTFH